MIELKDTLILPKGYSSLLSIRETEVAIKINIIISIKLTGFALVESLGIQLFWVVFLYFLSKWLWNRAVNKLVILGG